MTISRRAFIKSMALNSAAAAAATLFPGISFGAWKSTDLPAGSIQWKKTPCRFCGTGCGLLAGVSGDRAVAVKGDPNCSVNKGLCCVKGYHSVQILYGKDRIKDALVRKNGRMVKVPVQEALDLIAKKMSATIKSHGKDAVAMYGSGQWSIADGYAASKLFKGCIGTNNVEANARLCMASAVTGFLTSFGLDEPMGCYDDIDHADVFITWGNRPTGKPNRTSKSSILPPAPPAPARPPTNQSCSNPRRIWLWPTPSVTKSSAINGLTGIL